MPTYDYECNACGHKFEHFQSMTSEPLKKCPECNKNKLRRLIGTGAGIIFKGSGFYITDYRSDSYKAGAKADSNNGSSSTKSETKTESKAETKSEIKPAKTETKTKKTSAKND